MASYITPKKATEFIFYVTLTSQSSRPDIQSNPTLASGDVTISKDGGAFANLATLPAVTPASGKGVKVTVSSTEMNADNVLIIFSDVAGDQWDDVSILIQTTAQQIDDLATVAGVWAAATRTLTSFGSLVTDIVAAITAVSAQVIAALSPDSNNDIERYRGDTWSLGWTDIGSLSSYVTLDFTIKDPNRLYDNDANAVLKIRKNASGLNEGLLFLNGSTDGVTAGWGAITIDDAASGDITIAVNNNATYQLPPGVYLYDLQVVKSTGTTTLVIGSFTIFEDVTRAIS